MISRTNLVKAVFLLCSLVVYCPAADVTAAGVAKGYELLEGDILVPKAASADGSGSNTAMVSPKPWPGGIVPYVIDPDVRNPEDIRTAIKHWNDRTVLQFVPRTGQADYLRFPRLADNQLCSSPIGMTGGEQPIWVDGCGVVSIIHEIGHAVGLYHEHQRPDRYRYLTITKRTGFNEWGFILGNYEVASMKTTFDPYDYGSIMHYHLRYNTCESEMDSRPVGIPFGEATELSAGDIDAVARFYGAANRPVRVDSVPPGLTVRVDGRDYRTPASFNWANGETHLLEAVDFQKSNENTRYQFGRWSDEGSREHSITVSAEPRVFLASHIRQYRWQTVVDPPESGRIEAPAAPADGFLPFVGKVTISATPAGGWFFTGWHGSAVGGANPTQVCALPTPIVAAFSKTAPITIATDPPEMLIEVDGRQYYAPAHFPWVAGSAHSVRAVDSSSSASRTIFGSWEDGSVQAQRSIVADGRALTYMAKYRTEYKVRSSRRDLITISPESQDDFYPAGTIIQVAANEQYGQFQYWFGDVTGFSNPIRVRIDGSPQISPNYRTVVSGPVIWSVVNAAGYQEGRISPGEILSIFGSGLGPDNLAVGAPVEGRFPMELGGTRVTIGEVAAPVIAARSDQVNVIVPVSTASRYAANVVVENSRGSDRVLIPVSDAKAGLFSADGSGQGPGAILNQDWSLNGATNPASRGSYVSIYGTGGGLTDLSMADGELVPSVLARLTSSVEVSIAGRKAEVQYAGYVPSSVAGLFQINARIPLDIAPTLAAPVTVSIAGSKSNEVTAAIR